MFNRFPKKVGAKPGEVQQGAEKGTEEGVRGLGAEPREETLVQGQIRFNREGSGEGRGGFGAELGQVREGSEKGSREVVGRFGAERG